jgi:N-acetylneuraminic acid mutarotase
MKRCATSLLLLVLAALSAEAHFIWIVPDKPADGQTIARVFLSEDLRPEGADFLDKIASTELFVRGADGKTATAKWTRGKDNFEVKVPGAGPNVLGGSCRYGLFQRGEGEPFLLMYYPKVLLAPSPYGVPPFQDSWDQLPLEILPAKGGPAGTFRVLWKGKPLPGAEVVILAPGKDKTEEKKTGEDGTFALDAAKGTYGVRVRYVEAKAGEHDGKKYKEVRHYATLVFEVPEYAPLSRAVSSFGAAVADGWVYTYGGHCTRTHQYSTEAVVGTFQRLKFSDPKVWEELPGGPALQGLALVAHKGKIYRIGGMRPRNAPGEKADNDSVASFACFDPATKKWQDLPDLPEGRSSHDAVTVGDKLVVVGGWKMNGAGKETAWQNTALVLDLTRKPHAWEAVKQPFERRALTAAVHDGKVYVVGGYDKSDGIVLTVNVYDPAKGTWSAGPDLPGPQRNGFSPAACVLGDRLFVSTADGKLQRLTAKGDAWEEAGQLQQPRIVHRKVAIADKLLLVLGGAGKGENVALTEAIRPSPAKR